MRSAAPRANVAFLGVGTARSCLGAATGPRERDSGRSLSMASTQERLRHALGLFASLEPDFPYREAHDHGGAPTSYLYITTERMHRSGFDAQVLDPLRDLAKHGVQFDLLAIRSLRGGWCCLVPRESRVAEVRQSLAPGRVWTHAVPRPASRLGMAMAALFAVLHLMPRVIRGADCICHCRGRMAGFVGFGSR